MCTVYHVYEYMYMYYVVLHTLIERALYEPVITGDGFVSIVPFSFYSRCISTQTSFTMYELL